jgi:ribonuclease VapC
MIVIDASDLIAVLERESERDVFAAVIANADRCLVSAVTLLEAGMVLRGRRGAGGLDALMQMVTESGLEVIPFDNAQAALALDAFARYGKGIHPAARLNLGDCASYALAKGMDAPLLFKGGDFAATDLVAAV